MPKLLTSVTEYPFVWLDEVTELTLNPARGSAGKLKAEELSYLQDKFEQEVRQVFISLKTRTFQVFSPRKTKALVQQYYQAIRLLKQQAIYNQEHYPENSLLKTAGSAVIIYLDELSLDIEKRYPDYVQHQVGADDNQAVPASGIVKIICELSIDQMGIILKAADDVKLLVSRSLSLVFKSIVPYLSTANKKDLSWDSMRSNSYHPEERDKEIAIAALEKLIRKIREYK